MTDEPGRRDGEPDPDTTASSPAEPGAIDEPGATDQTREQDPAATAPNLPVGGTPTESLPPGLGQDAGAPRDRGPGGTSVMPPVPGDGPPPTDGPAEPPRWSARAQVRPARAGLPQEGDPRFNPTEEWVAAPPARGVVTPVLITIAVIILLLIFGLGVFLLLNGGRGEPPAGVTTTPPRTTAARTTATQSTAPPPTTTAPALIQLRDYSGIDYDTVLAELNLLGMTVRRTEEPSATIPAGAVIRTEPAAGQDVAKGSKVKVVVSTGAPPPTSVEPTPEPT